MDHWPSIIFINYVGFFFCQIGLGIVERLNYLLQQFQIHVIGGVMMFSR